MACCCFWGYISLAQIKNQKTIGLDEVIEISEQTSLDIFVAKHLYQSSVLEFKNFKVANLPRLNLDLDPLVFNSSIVERYDAILDRDVFRTVETLNSYVGLSISQNIVATGGDLFVRSNINRLENTGATSSLAFNTNLVQVGFNQPLFNFNRDKWNKKTEPLVFEKAKKEFVESRESLHVKAVEFFFDLASAQLSYDIAFQNKENAKKLYDIGRERFKIATINKEELLNLELNLLNTDVAIKRAKTELSDRQFALNTFLGNENHDVFVLELPESILKTEINYLEALDQAQQNSSEILNMKLKEITTLRDYDRIKKEGRLNPVFSGLIGLNKNAENLPNSYVDPLTQKRFSLRMTVPILNWGTINRRAKVALNRNKITVEENKNAVEELKRKVMTQIGEFNLQSELVDNALRSKKIAEEAYNLVIERFKYGNIDILKLNASQQAKDKAANNYLNSLREYWRNFYALQKLTLTDLKTNKSLINSFENELNIKQ